MPLQPHRNGSQASWIAERLQPLRDRTVGSVVPSGFERCARLLHPAYDSLGPVTWSRVARWSGRPLTPTSYFSDLGTRADGVRWTSLGSPPWMGAYSEDIALRLAELLSRCTSTPQSSLFCIWHGLGGIDAHQGALVDISPEWRASGRRYLLYQGSVEGVADVLRIGHSGSFVPPSLWWPEDRTWFVSTEVDAESTYIAGSIALIERLLSSEDMEVLPAALTDPFDGTHDGQEVW